MDKQLIFSLIIGLPLVAGFLRKLIFLLVFALMTPAPPVHPVSIPQSWRYYSEVRPKAPGLVKSKIPNEIIDVAGSGLSDMRILDARGQEVFCSFRQTTATVEIWNPFKLLSVKKGKRVTHLSGSMNLKGQRFDGIEVNSPAVQFINLVTVQGTKNGNDWALLADRVPLFREAGNVENMRVLFKQGAWKSLKISLRNNSGQPIPVSKISVRVAPPKKSELEVVDLDVGAVTDLGLWSQVKLNFPFNNMTASAVRIETDEPVFQRYAEVRYEKRAGIGIQSVIVGKGTTFRVLNGRGAAVEQLTIPVDKSILPKQIMLHIYNGNNVPLKIKKASAVVFPWSLIFNAKPQGSYVLIAGNPSARPKTDLLEYDQHMKGEIFKGAVFGPVLQNPLFKESGILPQVDEEWAPIDVSPWAYRKKVKVYKPGIQNLILDLDVLTQDPRGISDVRLVKDGKQIPYLVDKTLMPAQFCGLSAQEFKGSDPKKNVWKIKLPYTNMPIGQIQCMTEKALFDRTVVLYEEAQNERGEKIREYLGQNAWTRKEEKDVHIEVVPVSKPPRTKTVFLEISNGDNPPLPLKEFAYNYDAKSLLFKASPGSEIHLYYGNPGAPEPNYEISLMRDDIQKAPATIASLDASKEVLNLEPKRDFGFESIEKSWGDTMDTIGKLIFIIILSVPGIFGAYPIYSISFVILAAFLLDRAVKRIFPNLNEVFRWTLVILLTLVLIGAICPFVVIYTHMKLISC